MPTVLLALCVASLHALDSAWEVGVELHANGIQTMYAASKRDALWHGCVEPATPKTVKTANVLKIIWSPPIPSQQNLRMLANLFSRFPRQVLLK